MSTQVPTGSRTWLRLGKAIGSVTLVALLLVLVLVADALANPAPIHIHGTGGDGVFIRPTADTSRPAIGWMPEGASPDYHCFVWGERIGTVPIWFNVTYNGVTGYYSSYYDDSSYQSNEELTAKYGVPLCGTGPPPPSTPPSTPPSPAPVPAPAPGGQTPATPSPAVGYFAPYKMADDDALHVQDPATLNVKFENWSSSCKQPTKAYSAANTLLAPNQSYKTLAGWSRGRVGVIAYLKSASTSQLDALNYVLLIDPGVYDELGDCDKTLKAGAAFARWLAENPQAHLAIISTSAVTQQHSSKGIQEVYFNTIRDRSTPNANLRARVLTCNYSLPGNTLRVFGRSAHERAMLTGQYWIQHEIGTSTKPCPWLSEGDNVYKPTAGWHP